MTNTTNLSLPLIAGNNTADVVRDVNAVANGVDAKVGVANGLAKLGADGKVPSGQLPAMDYVPNTAKGVANGVATLGTDGKVPASQLNVNSTADKISIADAGGYFTATDTENALQEIGQTLNTTRGSLITSANSLLGS